MKKLVVGASLGLLILVLGLVGLLWSHFLHSPASRTDTEVIYEVVQGRSFTAVARDLQQRGIISNSGLFSLLGRIRGEASKMKVGEYAFRTSMLPQDVLDVLISGKSIGRNFTITEGLNIYEIANLVEQAKIGRREDFLKLVHDPIFIASLLGEKHDSLEGYLFPETYQVTKFTDLKTLVRTMVQRCLAAYATISAQADQLHLTRHQMVTLASLIEKESGAASERPLISSIFYNRMAKGMMLQTDPTVLYAKIRKSGNLEMNITKIDLQMDDDYNTYKRTGLPPGPISNPGMESFKAAVEPAHSEYLYFVSRNDGTSIFSKDYETHLKAVQKYQLDPRAREGKSWRDLSKNKAQPTPAAAATQVR